MNETDLVFVLEAIRQLQEMCRALLPLRSPHFERLAECQLPIELMLRKYAQHE